MRKLALQKKIKTSRWVKSNILKYLRDNTVIIEDKNSNHTGYYYVPDYEFGKTYILVDWDYVLFVPNLTLRSNLKHKLANRAKLLSSDDVKIIKRWFV